MNVIWFLVLGAMMTAYAVLDGYDLGVGAIMPLVCRSEEERQTARASIGPVWNGNEVWLLAGGGTMFVAFPRLYAASFSGFYLALMIVLWLLMLRGIGIEFRHAQKHPMWTGAWDFAFSLSSALLAVLFGVAVGNVLRGVPLDSQGEFQGSFALMLNPFAILAGVLSLATLALHGAAYLVIKTEGDLQARARLFAGRIWAGVAVLALAFTVASFYARPGFEDNFMKAPYLLVLPALAIIALVQIPLSAARGRDGKLFGGTCLLIVSLLGCAAAGLFPRLLPAMAGSPENDLTIYNTASSEHGMTVALIVWAVGMVGALFYVITVHRIWSGKVKNVHY